MRLHLQLHGMRITPKCPTCYKSCSFESTAIRIFIVSMRFSAILLGALAYQVGSSVAETLVRQSSFWSAKNIFISVLVPGSSHTTWVLEIGQELATRGHNVSFLCNTDGAKYARDYPNINILSMGEPDFSLTDTDMIEISARKDDQVESTKMFFTAINAGFRKYYLQFADYIREFNPDLMICDFLTDSCSHAADKHDIPFIVTSTAAAFPGKTWNIASDAIRGFSHLFSHNCQQMLLPHF